MSILTLSYLSANISDLTL